MRPTPPPTAIPMMAVILSGNELEFSSSFIETVDPSPFVAVVAVLFSGVEAVGVGVETSKVKTSSSPPPPPSIIVVVGYKDSVGETVGLTEGKVDGASLTVTEGDTLGKI